MSNMFKINVSVLVRREGKFLILKRSLEEDIFPGLWGVPGGTVEWTRDPTLEAALRREVREETGAVVDTLRLVQENIGQKEAYGVLYLVYLADFVGGAVSPGDGTDECLWAGSADIASKEFTPTTKETLLRFYAGAGLDLE